MIFFFLEVSRQSFQGQLPNVQISRSFAGEFHTRSVRTLATSSRFLASGGADDRVRIYDLRKRAETKELFSHDGTVNTVVFLEGGKYLMSGGDDGKITFTNTQTWEVDKEWKNAHKGAVRCIAIHPDGALALTVGADLVLKSWNLVNGRNVYSTSLKNKPQYGGIVELVRWSPDGEHFAVTGARCVEVFSLESGKVVRTHKTEHRTTDLCWIGDADLLLGLDNGEMLFFNVETEEKNVIPAHEARLKAMFYVEGLLATISSAGELCLWSISEDYTEIVQLRAYNLDFRPICLCIVESSKLGLTFEKDPILDESKADFDVEADEVTPKIASEDRVIVEYEDGGLQGKKRKAPDTDSSEDSSECETFKGQKKKAVLDQIPEVKTEKPPKRRFKQNKLNKKRRAQKKAMHFEESDVTEPPEKAQKKIKYVKQKKALIC